MSSNGSFLYKDKNASERWIFSELLLELNSSSSTIYMTEFDSNISSEITADINGYAVINTYNLSCSVTPTPTFTSTPTPTNN